MPSTPTAEPLSPMAGRRGGSSGRRAWLPVGGMVGFVVLLHVLGFSVLLGLVTPQHLSLGESGVFGLGVGITAYLLGVRHAFDADHIAAIDNTTRKLMADGQRPRSVGFWFSLGHSSIVFGLALLLSVGIRALAGQVENETSTLQATTGLIGLSVSGTFLMLIGVINLVALVGIGKVLRRMRQGSFDEAELEEQLNRRGLMNRILGGVTKTVRRPWHMYPVGLLFGLGFDTATEISLLVLAAGATAFSLPWYAILVLPVLFAAGMSLFDTADGYVMTLAYGWAFARPIRKIYYSLTVTALSVAVAFIIGSIELISILTDRAGIDSGPLAAIAGLDLDQVGYGIVGLFIVTWALAVAAWRLGRLEERWSRDLRATACRSE